MEKTISVSERLIERRSEERALVEAAVRGDGTAFDQLARTHSTQVFRVAYGMLGNREDAADVQQEAFVNAYRNLRKFRGEASFGTWMYTITARLCLARKRTVKRKLEELTESNLLQAGCLEDSPESAVMALDSARRIGDVLARMSVDDRLLIVLKLMEQLSHREIAEVLGCSEESSRARLTRAKKIFREMYGEME